MRLRPLLLAAALAALAGGCNTVGSSLGEVGSSLGTNIGRDVNPYGTQRRPDVNYAFTRPSVPSIAYR